MAEGTKEWPKDVDYYEGNPDGFDVYSWTPAPPGSVGVKSTQVHLHALVGGSRIVYRFKGPNTLDRLIDALVTHRVDVFGPRPGPDEEEDETRCTRCRGCGQIADSTEGEPWTDWKELPPGADLAVRLGVVKPLKCPACDGTGRR